MKKYIPTVLIVIGIVLALFPHINDWYGAWKQAKLLKEWEQTVDMAEPQNMKIQNTEEASTDIVDKEEKETKKPGDLEGLLRIPNIDLELPILVGVSHENMLGSVASINSNYSPGDIGNYAISGHRSITYGKNFNRLDELEEGDLVYIDTPEKTYTYKINSKIYVLPKDTWVLNDDEDKRILTLVTCHPIKISSHRLILSGELLE